jgi:SHS2 domain-containing protein
VAAGFTFLDHTADVGIVAVGDDLASVYVHAAEGMFTLMVDLESVAETLCRTVEVSASDREALLVEWLNELLFLVDAERLVFKRFVVEEVTDTHLTALAYGERIDPARHRFKVAVKAATYHMLSLTGGPPYRGQVILDL